MELTTFQQECIPTRTSAKIDVPNGIIYTYTMWEYPAATYFYGDAVSELNFDTEKDRQKWIGEKMQEEAA